MVAGASSEEERDKSCSDQRILGGTNLSRDSCLRQTREKKRH